MTYIVCSTVIPWPHILVDDCGSYLWRTTFMPRCQVFDLHHFVCVDGTEFEEAGRKGNQARNHCMQCHTWNRFQVKVTWNCIHLSYLAWEVEDKHHRQEEQVQIDNNFLFHPNPFYYALPHLNIPDTTQQYSYIILYWLTKFAILFILKCSYNIHNIQENYTTSRTPIVLQLCPRYCSKILHSFA